MMFKLPHLLLLPTLLCPSVASVASSTPSAPSTLSTSVLKGQLRVHPEYGAHRLLVKFRADATPVLDAQGRVALASVPLAKAAVLPDLRYTHALDDLAAPRARRAAGAPDDGSDGRVFAEFAGLLYVDAPGADNDSLLRLGRALEALDVVEYATLEPLHGPPPPGAVDLPPVTPSFTDRQGWLGPSSSNGVDCRYAWTRGALGRGVRLHDVEDSWGDLDHEDFDVDSLGYARPRFSDTYADHGIAVFGATFAQHNGYGVDGCAPQATGRAYSFQNSNGSQSRAATLVLMGEQARPGDVILLEMQAGGWGGDNLGPADLDVAVWNATKAATDKGVVVIGTAGNGQANLDGATYDAYRARGDNGVIMASGGNSNTRARQVGSYGACCVHVQGWGHNVTTTGYSNLFKPNGDIRQGYTSTFSGTSSAGAVVAAAAVSLQSHALAVLGRPLAPREMRSILVATGRAHTGAFHIGPLPDLRAAILHVDSLAALEEVGVRAEARLLRGDGRAWEFAVPPGASRVTVEIFDLHGRAVWSRSIMPARASSGRRILWDGRDARGAVVPPGQYVARVTEVRDGRALVLVRRGLRLASR